MVVSLMVKSAIKKTKEVESKLITALKEDTKLDKDTKMSYISMANIYLDKFEENLNKTSIELNTDIPLGIDVWKDFLNYPVVRSYIQSFRDERIMQVADKGLMYGDKNAVSIKKAMNNNGPAINNSQIVLIRLPEKMEFE